VPDLRRLRYFVAVATERNFTRAAERLRVAQPALSRQVRLLERELGVELLRRTTHEVALTDAARFLLAWTAARAPPRASPTRTSASGSSPCATAGSRRCASTWTPATRAARRSPRAVDQF
jgi:DNA-binding transcriptional LysR family regulator